MRFLLVLLRLLLRDRPSAATAPQKDGADDLLALARAAFDFEHARYDSAETKAARYVTVLALVVAGVAIKGDDLLWTLRHSTVRWFWLIPFVISYVTMFTAAFWALALALRAMTVEKVPALPLDNRLPDLFQKHDRADAVRAMAQSFFTEAKKLRCINGHRTDGLEKICRRLNVTLWAAAVSLILYVPIAWTTPERETSKTQGSNSMTKPNDQGGSQQQQQQQQQQQKPTTAQPPTFDTIKKGDSTSRETATQKPK